MQRRNGIYIIKSFRASLRSLLILADEIYTPVTLVMCSTKHKQNVPVRCISILHRYTRYLTYDSEMYEVAKVRRGRHLALVDTGVPVLGVLNLKSPVFGMGLMYRPETLVACVGISAHCQKVDVAVPHPRHLQRHLQWSDSSTGSLGGGVHSTLHLNLCAIKCTRPHAFPPHNRR